MDRPAPASVFPGQLAWENEGTSRIPFMSYTSEALHRLELERFFYRKHWCYVGLEAEVPNPGDFRVSVVGERSVILARDLEGGINVVENVCAHRGMSFAASARQPARLHLPLSPVELLAQGRPAGRARRGVRQEGKINGGMPADFKLEENGLTQARVATRGGVVFASFDPDVEPLETSSAGGAALLRPPVRRPRPEDPRLQPAADSRQLEADAGKHQGPVSPGTAAHLARDLRPLARRQQVAAGDGRASPSRRDDLDPRPDGQGRAGDRGVELKADMKLEDPRFLDIVAEPWWGGPTAVMTTIFPSVIFQQQVNSVSTRHIQPDGHGAFDFVWTHFGFADDSEEMTQRRLRQANLFGPAGFVSADDGEVIELSRRLRRPMHPGQLGSRTSPIPTTWSRDADPRHVQYWPDVEA
jgi:salicylate 5-hydroxylase large subunit